MYYDTNNLGLQIIGSTFLYPQSLPYYHNIRPEHFSDPWQAATWDAIQTLHSKGEVIAPYIVSPILIQKCEIKTEETRKAVNTFLAEAANSVMVADPRSWAYNATSLIDAFGRTRLNHVSDLIKRRTTEGSMSTIEQIEIAIKEVSEVAKKLDIHKERRTMREMIENALDIAEATRKGGGGISTGIKSLDNALAGGFHSPDLIILAGASGMGKTAFALNCMINALRAGKHVVFFSLEMAENQIINRMLSEICGIHGDKLRTGDLTEEDYSQIHDVSREMGDFNFVIDDTSDLSIDVLQARVRQWNAQKKVDMIFIDYIQLLSHSERGNFDRHDLVVTDIAKRLKSLAKEFGVPVIALSQINVKNAANRQNPRPMPEDLSDSSGIQANADVVMMLYRAEYYHFRKKPDETAGFEAFTTWKTTMDEIAGKGEIIIGKNRMGSPTDISLRFDHKRTKFLDA